MAAVKKRLVFLLIFALAAGGSASGENKQARRLNILLFTADSCRADRFGCYGYRGGTTPNIDNWAKSGTLFEKAYSTSAWTVPGLASILTGLYPPAHGLNNRDQAGSPRLVTMMKFFQQQGYVVPNLNFFTFAPYYRNFGLGRIENEYFTQTPGEELAGWIEKTASPTQPFFIWYHCTTIHQPYNPPAADFPGPREELMKRPGIKAVMTGAIVPAGSTQFTESDRPILNGLYDAEMKRMDRIFAAALAKLANKGLLENTLVIFAADHGEELLDHGFVGHASTSLQAKLYQELTRIPLILSCPGLIKRGRISRPVNQTDIFPTLLRLLGLKPPVEMDGQDLFKGPSRPLFFESVVAGNQTTREREKTWIRGTIDRNYKYISTGELYDLKKDPGEKNNVIKAKAAVAARLEAQVGKWMSASKQRHDVLFPPESKPAPPDRAEAPTIFTPENGKKLDYDVHTGMLLFDWSGDMETTYLVEYDIGLGDHHVAGVYETQGNHQLLGPLGRELWENLKAWNPFKIRVSRKTAPPVWSAWTTFEF
ncbi:MAG: DUF229 domain-containing protein [Acidobacteria bacterium]|nr:MAG: DUF229 domain-containing protein [Acidobacteriota bacterium]